LLIQQIRGRTIPAEPQQFPPCHRRPRLRNREPGEPKQTDPAKKVKAPNRWKLWFSKPLQQPPPGRFKAPHTFGSARGIRRRSRIQASYSLADNQQTARPSTETPSRRHALRQERQPRSPRDFKTSRTSDSGIKYTKCAQPTPESTTQNSSVTAGPTTRFGRPSTTSTDRTQRAQIGRANQPVGFVNTDDHGCRSMFPGWRSPAHSPNPAKSAPAHSHRHPPPSLPHTDCGLDPHYTSREPVPGVSAHTRKRPIEQQNWSNVSSLKIIPFSEPTHSRYPPA